MKSCPRRVQPAAALDCVQETYAGSVKAKATAWSSTENRFLCGKKTCGDRDLIERRSGRGIPANGAGCVQPTSSHD